MKIRLDDKFFEPFLSSGQIGERTAELGYELNRDYADKNPVFIGVLNGGFMFMADLMKTVQIRAEITFVKLASYEGDKSTGQIQLQLGLTLPLAGRDVIIVEDIVDSGYTLHYLLEMLLKENPGSVRVCSLLYKPKACKYRFEELKYIGFEIPDVFVAGYGLDYNGWGRNLKDIYRLVGD